MKLMHKELIPEECPVLWQKPFTEEVVAEEFEVKGGKWSVKDGWLTGENPGNFPGMIISRADFCENVVVEVTASTVAPCTHDINLMWNGSWDEETNTRHVAYVAGLAGWWEGKVGFEKSPDYLLNVATQIFPFEAGRNYRIQAGSIDGHIFIIVDGALVLELTDPDPIDPKRYGRIGFEAYCAKVRFRDLCIRKAVWTPLSESYIPEF